MYEIYRKVTIKKIYLYKCYEKQYLITGMGHLQAYWLVFILQVLSLLFYLLSTISGIEQSICLSPSWQIDKQTAQHSQCGSKQISGSSFVLLISQ